jgi:hypothetical protein
MVQETGRGGSTGAFSESASLRVAEFHELQGERYVLIHLPFDEAMERIRPILEGNGSAKFTPSSALRLVVVGKWRTALRLKYEVTLFSTEANENTAAQFFSRKPAKLDRMLTTQLLPRLNLGGTEPRPTLPVARLRPLASRKDVRLRFSNYDGGFPGHSRPERKGKLTLLRATPTVLVRWRHTPKGMLKTSRLELAQWSLEPQEQPSGRSCHLVIRDRQDPHVVAELDLPSVSGERFRRLLETKLRKHAATWRPIYNVANYDGGLPAHLQPEGFGTLTLVRGIWILRFPGADELFNGLVTDQSLTVSRTGPTSCRVAITVPQRLGEEANFDLPGTPAEIFSAELDTRKEIAPTDLKRLSRGETKQVLKATRQFQQGRVSKGARRSSPAAALATLFVLLAGLAIGIPLVLTSTSPSPSISSGNSGGSSSSGITDNCQAGYGYLDVNNNLCYQGTGPDANNAAGNGAIANCPSGFPDFNAGTDRCYSAVPSASSSVSSGPSASAPTTSAPGSATSGPAQCGLSEDQTGTETIGLWTYNFEIKKPTPGCYLHVTESRGYNGAGVLDNGFSGCEWMPSTVSNIIAWMHAWGSPDGSNDELYQYELSDGQIIPASPPAPNSVASCIFSDYSFTELNHLTNYYTIG